MDIHEVYMREALREAAKAEAIGEVPVGAVVVREGEILARAYNRVEVDRTPLAHAEMLAIREAEKAVGAKWLTGCDLYVTLEPCAMCAGAMVLARIDRLVYGAKDPKGGAAGSVFSITEEARLNHHIETIGGILETECGGMLTAFFRRMRQTRPKRRFGGEAGTIQIDKL